MQRTVFGERGIECIIFPVDGFHCDDCMSPMLLKFKTECHFCTHFSFAVVQ